MKINRKLISGVVHVWSILDNAWMPEREWDEIEAQRLRRLRESAAAHRAQCSCVGYRAKAAEGA
jgi:hypothetical protein